MDDLSDVLRHLNRHTRRGQRQLANHPLTRAYLEAGMRLVAEEFVGQPAGEDEEPQRRSFLWMSREQVIKEVARGAEDPPHLGNPGTLRDRWPYFSHYLGDLILYALRLDVLRTHTDLAKQAADAIGDDMLSTVAHEIAYRDLALDIGETATRFQFFVTAFADHDPVVAKALSAVYREVTESWRSVYDEFVDARGLTLRPGLSFDDFDPGDGATLEETADRMADPPSGTPQP